MKFDKKFYAWATGMVPSVAAATQAFGSEVSINTLPSYFAASSITADPSVMVIVGIALIGLRMLIARRGKRREKDPAHF